MKQRIKVRSNDFKFGDLGTPAYVDVLSKYDFQYFKTRQQDIQFRLLAELNDPNTPNATFHFVTLTYDNDHLPEVIQQNTFYKFSDEDPEKVVDEFIEEKVINVALTRDIQNFNKRLRHNIARHLGEQDQTSIKYLLCHEYGKEDDYLDDFGKLRTGTARAHYHGIYKCENGLAEDVFQKLVDESWCKGRTLNPKLEGDDCFQAISYTSKYVSKDLLLTAPKFRPQKEGYTLVKSEYFSLPDESGFSRPVDLKEINPRVLTSKNLGAAYVHEDNDLESPLRADLFLKGQHKLQLNKDNECINIPLPRYYFQKYCKDNAHYVALSPDNDLLSLVHISLGDEQYLDYGVPHSRKVPYYYFEDGSRTKVREKSVSSDSFFYRPLKAILADRNAIRKTEDFLDYFYSIPAFSKVFKPDYIKIKEYMRNRFSIFQYEDLVPHVLPSGSNHLFYGRYGTATCPMPILSQRYVMLKDIDPYFFQLEILLNSYETFKENQRCSRNVVREYEQRKRRKESHDRKIHRGHWRRSVS